MLARRKAVGGLFVVLLVCSLPAWAQRAWDTASQQAVLTADWPKVAAAAQAWKQRAPAAPAAVVADWLLGYAGLATADYRLATEGFQRLGAPQTAAQLHAWADTLVAQQPQHAVAQMLYGDALARSGNYTAALAALDEAARLTPHTALLYDVRGVVRALAGQAEAAETDFRRALTLDGQFADAYCSLGLLQLRQGGVAAALASLTRALELAPEHPAARNARGVAYLHAGALAPAVEDLTQAVRGSAYFPPAVENLQIAQESQRRFAWRGAIGRGAAMALHSITLVVADPRQMTTATAWASGMVQERTGQPPVVVHTRQEALTKAETQPVILLSSVGDLGAVAGASVREDLQALGAKASVSVITLGVEGAYRGTQGVQGYLDTTPRERQLQIASVQLITPSEVAGLAGKLPLDNTDLGTIARQAKEIHSQGIPVAVYETAGKPGVQHISNVKAFRDAGVDTYATPWQGSVDMSLGLSPKPPYVNPGIRVSNAADSAASRNDLKPRDWTVYRGGSEQHIRGTLNGFGQEYIGDRRQPPAPKPPLPDGVGQSGEGTSGTPRTPGTAYVLPSRSTTPVSGVDLSTDVVEGGKADFSAMLGTAAGRAGASVPRPESLSAPFLLFMARAPRGY